jgi:hypothetical protein
MKNITKKTIEYAIANKVNLVQEFPTYGGYTIAIRCQQDKPRNGATCFHYCTMASLSPCDVAVRKFIDRFVSNTLHSWELPTQYN